MSALATPSAVSVSVGGQGGNNNKRLQLESVIREFQGKLGADWETYHEALSQFLVGRISRAELVQQIGPLMKNGMLKYHNKLLLLNFANTLQDTAPEFSSELASFWNKRNAKPKNVKLSQYEKFKQNIMGLPLKERRRIRAITKDAGKKDRLSASITLTRQALLPKIPMLQDKEQQQLQVNNLVTWQQDVVNGINTPLASASHELPDADTLSRKVLMTSREHGLTGGINARVFEVLALGLETHLKNVLECAIDTVRYRRRKYELSAILHPGFLQGGSVSHVPASGSGTASGSLFGSLSGAEATSRDLEALYDKRDVTIGTEDMYNTLEMFPHLVEPGGPQARLSSVMLQNDDLADPHASGYELPPRPVPIDSTPDTVKANGVVQNGARAVPPTRDPALVGSVDELKWMLHDLVSSS